MRCFDLAEVDRIVVVFAREFGKIRGVAPGAKRFKSNFTGSLDTGTHVQVQFLEKEGVELVRFKHAKVISHFAGLSELFRLLHLMYMTELLDAFSTDHNPNQDLFRLAIASFQELHGGADPVRLARYFEYWILRLEGIWPGVRFCGLCESPLGSSTVCFSRAAGCFTCGGCRREEGVHFGPADLEVLQGFAKLPPAQLPAQGGDGASLGKLEAVAQSLIRRHLGFDIKSYRMLKELTAA